jgi:tetratricopeptide (TPR) repeat protein
MKKLAGLLLIAMAPLATSAESPTLSADPNLSPAERGIAQANRLIDKNPKDFEAYNALALALSRRARETSDVTYYTRAEEALQKSFVIAPDNFDGARMHVWLLLGKHEFAGALEEAKKLNKKIPDDIMVYGFLTDANVELGNYQDAEAAAQWMLDLRPGNLAGLTRAAYLRELFGDPEGALELMHMALESTPPAEVEDAAWISTQMAHLELAMGKASEAEKDLQQALTLYPGYHYALGNLAKVRVEQKRYQEAILLLKQRYEAAPHAENLFDLAEALQLAGRSEDAKRAFAEFEEKSLLETHRADNSNRELIFYYAAYAHQPTEALRVAQSEAARRHDVYTMDALAWALYVNHRYAEARQQIEKALAVGIRDARFFYHAGAIAWKLNDRDAAEHYLTQSLETDAHSMYASPSREMLAALAPSPGGERKGI